MSHVGRLLVATPLIGDPNFERTVLLLLAHGPEGALGVVLNRPSALPAEEVAGEWASKVAAPGVLFIGGPVDTDSVIGLAHGVGTRFGFEPLVDGLGTVDLNQRSHPGGPPWSGLRLFVGSAGWAPGQIEDEIADGAWWVADASGTDVATSDPDGLWRRVVARQPGRVAWFANCPLDPSQN